MRSYGNRDASLSNRFHEIARKSASGWARHWVNLANDLPSDLSISISRLHSLPSLGNSWNLFNRFSVIWLGSSDG